MAWIKAQLWQVLRSLVRSPLFTLVALLTLAVGIGGDFLAHSQQVALTLQQGRRCRFLRDVERTLRTCHPGRTLFEEIVGAVAMHTPLQAWSA